MIVRVARKTEDKELSELWLRSTLASHSFIPETFWQNKVKTVEKFCIGQSLNFICEEKGKVLGFVSFTKPGFIGGLFVEEKEQHKGVGTKLLNQGKRLFSRLELDVYEKNTDAVEFYKKRGFLLEFSHIGDETKEVCLRLRWHR